MPKLCHDEGFRRPHSLEQQTPGGFCGLCDVMYDFGTQTEIECEALK